MSTLHFEAKILKSQVARLKRPVYVKGFNKKLFLAYALKQNDEKPNLDTREIR